MLYVPGVPPAWIVGSVVANGGKGGAGPRFSGAKGFRRALDVTVLSSSSLSNPSSWSLLSSSSEDSQLSSCTRRFPIVAGRGLPGSVCIPNSSSQFSTSSDCRRFFFALREVDARAGESALSSKSSSQFSSCFGPRPGVLCRTELGDSDHARKPSAKSRLGVRKGLESEKKSVPIVEKVGWQRCLSRAENWNGCTSRRKGRATRTLLEADPVP